MPNYDVNYDDSRFQKVESDKNAALKEVDKTYGDMISQSDRYYQSQIDASKDWAKEQTRLQQQQTDFAIQEINQQKDQAKKDYTREQSGAYVDWQKQSNEYGANAEQMASAGMTNTGFSESSQVSMYNTYQNRVATARESYNLAVQNYNNAITEARLQNNSILAEIAHEALQTQLELSLQGFQYKNTLIQARADKKTQLESEYYSRYQDVLAQINHEIALAEEVRQYNEKMAEEKRQYNQSMEMEKKKLAEEQRQYNATLALQKEQFAWEKSQAKQAAKSSAKAGDGGGPYGTSSSSKKSSTKKSSTKKTSDNKIAKGNDKTSTSTMKSVLDLGYGPISAKNLAGKVASGEVKESTKNGTTVFEKNTAPLSSKTLSSKSKAKSYTGVFGATSRLKK